MIRDYIDRTAFLSPPNDPFISPRRHTGARSGSDDRGLPASHTVDGQSGRPSSRGSVRDAGAAVCTSPLGSLSPSDLLIGVASSAYASGHGRGELEDPALAARTRTSRRARSCAACAIARVPRERTRPPPLRRARCLLSTRPPTRPRLMCQPGRPLARDSCVSPATISRISRDARSPRLRRYLIVSVFPVAPAPSRRVLRAVRTNGTRSVRHGALRGSGSRGSKRGCHGRLRTRRRKGGCGRVHSRRHESARTQG
jgi:hypothetical protein